jgi:hypothetical protein
MRKANEFFDHLKNVGFQPETIIDVGVARGTIDIYDAYPDAYYVLIEPVEEFKPDLVDLLKRLKGEYHLCAR